MQINFLFLFQLDEWIYDEGFDQPASVYKEKLAGLSKLFEPIKERVQQHRDRPEAIQARKQQILIYLSLFFLCAFSLLVLHLIIHWKELMEQRQSQCAKDAGQRSSIVGNLTGNLFALTCHLWRYMSLLGEYFKSKGRRLVAGGQDEESSAGNSGKKGWHKNFKYVRRRTTTQHFGTNR